MDVSKMTLAQLERALERVIASEDELGRPDIHMEDWIAAEIARRKGIR